MFLAERGDLQRRDPRPSTREGALQVRRTPSHRVTFPFPGRGIFPGTYPARRAVRASGGQRRPLGHNVEGMHQKMKTQGVPEHRLLYCGCNSHLGGCLGLVLNKQ